MVDFTNENDVLDMRIKYKDDNTVIKMLNEIEDLQDTIRQLQGDASNE